MPFKSEKQRRFLWAEHPEIAKRWAHEYPESNKNLPTYAKNKDDKDNKKAASSMSKNSNNFNVSLLLSEIAGRTYFPSPSILAPEVNENSKKADSKQEKVDIPHTEEPTYAGEEREKGMISSSVDTGANINESCGKNAINELLQKLSVVLAPAIEQTMENMNAENEGRVPVRVGKNHGLKQYPQATPQIPLPMGMQQPAQPQQPQQAQQKQPASTTPVGAGQSSATTDPIKFHSGLSASGIINGNASLSAPNTVNTKISRAGDEIQGILTSIEYVDPSDISDLLTEERMKSAIEKWAGTPAWQRAAGKNDEGGLNAKGRASYNRETGGNLKAPVTEKNPTGERNKRQNSFCSRMCGMKRVNTGAKTKSDPDSRINKALRKWNCKCGSVAAFIEKLSQDFDPALSRDAENAILHGTGLVGSGALGAAAGMVPSMALDSAVSRAGYMPDAGNNPYGHAAAKFLVNMPAFVGSALGMRLYDQYIMKPHMKREMARKQEEEEERLRQQADLDQMMPFMVASGLKKRADASLQRILGTALASTGGGLLVGGYPGWKLQRASEAAGNNDFVNFIAGKAPIALAGALSGAAFNHVYDKYEKKHPKKRREPEHPSLKYLQYMVH